MNTPAPRFRSRSVLGRVAIGLCILAPALAWASAEGGHQDPFAFILLELAIVVAVAMAGRSAARSTGQPTVLGELLAGVLLGNLGVWLGLPFFELVMNMDVAGAVVREAWTTGTSTLEAAQGLFPNAQGAEALVIGLLSGPDAPRLIIMTIAIWMFSNFGVILLLLMVGLESSVDEMKQSGLNALLVAFIGAALPMLLGYGAGVLLLPDAGTAAHLFLGATLTATSVGITARVLKDMGKLGMPEAKIILGAAVIDDILGLVILAVVVGIIASGTFQFAEVGRIALLSLAFIGVVMVLGERLAALGVRVFARIEQQHLKLLFPIGLAFVLAWLANQIELATIVGAFAAGLVLHDVYFADADSKDTTIEQTIAPLEATFAPVFFVLMGMQVNLATFTDPATIGIAGALCVVAIASKAIAGIAAGAGMDRLSVGLAMVPRGEVGLIFANIGKAVGVVSDSIFAAIVMMVMVTTFIAPIALRWSLTRQG
ncbi:MAG: cation:proton antiporter [Pseudomonadales bacterium]